MSTKLGPHILIPTEAAKHWAANAPIVLWAFRPPAWVRGLQLAGQINQNVPLMRIMSAAAIQTIRLQADAMALTAVPAVLNAARPGAITVCRPIWMLPRDGRQAAKEILARYDSWGVKPTYTQLWNEFDEWGRDELRERLRQGRIAGDILRARGFKVGDNIASTGTLESYEWLIAADEGWGGMDVLFIHEYRGNEGMTTWHMLRYRRMHDVVNGNHPLVIVSETGRDRVEGGRGGHKADGVSTEQFVGELKAYDAEIQKDPYILGATPFTSGPTDDWANYDMDGLEQYLIEEEEEPMPPDYRRLAHEIVDQAYKDATGGEGFNPDTAFGEYTGAGMPNGPIRYVGLIAYQSHALGTLVVPIAKPQKDQVKLFPPGLDGETMLAAYLAALPNP